MEDEIANAPELTAKQGTDIVLLLANPAIPSGMRTAVSRVVNVKVTGVKTRKKSGQTTFVAQQCPTFDNFGTKKFWDLLMDPSTCPSRVIACVSFLMERMGLVHGDAAAWTAALSTIIGAAITRGTHHQAEISADDAYLLLQKLKKICGARQRGKNFPIMVRSRSSQRARISFNEISLTSSTSRIRITRDSRTMRQHLVLLTKCY
jgi:hypothetical protein